jgi:hypothetical protein
MKGRPQPILSLVWRLTDRRVRSDGIYGGTQSGNRRAVNKRLVDAVNGILGALETHLWRRRSNHQPI